VVNMIIKVNSIEEIKKFSGPGVWAVYGKENDKRICLNVAETQNIADEISMDIDLMKDTIEGDEENKYVARNNFGEIIFKCPSRYYVRKYTWIEISKYKNLEFECVAFNIHDRSERVEIEKYIAYKTRAKYWRHKRSFTNKDRMNDLIDKYIEKFEKKSILKRSSKS